MRTDELADGTVFSAQTGKRKVVVYLGEGRVSAIEEARSHAGGPLSRGKVDEGVVTCP